MKIHTSAWKKKQLDELRILLEKYPVIAIGSLERFPASLFQVLRKKLAGKAIVKVSKVRVVKKALLESKIKADGLEKFVDKSIAVIFTEMNPFELYAFIKRNKGNVFAKPGLIAVEDIVVPKGDTGLPPGPALSDLKAAGLNPRLQGATILIPNDVVVVKKGEAVSKVVSSTLSKLNIKPVKVGLSLTAVYENGQIFEPSVLDIDSEKVFEKFVTAQRNAFNLAVNSAYATKETIPVLIGKAFNESKAVALEAGIFEKETIELFLAKASAQANALKQNVA